MENRYMFTEMVEGEEDIEGMIAYCLYKFEKMKYIRHYEHVTGKQLTDDELKAYQDKNFENINKFKEKSGEILSNSINILIEPEVDKLNKGIEELESEKKKLDIARSKFAEHKSTQFRFGIWVNLASPGVLLIISALIVFMLKFGDISGWILNIIKAMQK